MTGRDNLRVLNFLQENFSGSNTDVSFATVVSNSFLSPIDADIIVFGII